MSNAPATSRSFTIRSGDEIPYFRVQAWMGNNLPIPIEGATFTFHLYDAAGVEVLQKPCIPTESLRVTLFEVQWNAGDTDLPGSYKALIKGIYPDGRSITLPSRGFFSVEFA